MSTTTAQRSVAEIVWDIVHQPCINRRQPDKVSALTSRDCEAINCREWVARGWLVGDRSTAGASPRTEYSLSDFGEPTVDDMLAWLSAHVLDGQWNNEGVIGIMYKPHEVELQWYSSEGVDGAAGRTLHAALEAAVRAVSGLAETPESNPT